VSEALKDGFVTGDLAQIDHAHPVQSTSDMGTQIAARIREI
jgi:3-isopropylmalate dehydrogenase